MTGPTSVDIDGNSVFKSNINTCNMDLSDYSQLFYCVAKGTTYNDLSLQQVIDNFNAQFGTDVTQENEMYQTLMSNFTSYVLTYGNFTFQNSGLLSSRIGICASNITMNTSSFTSTGMGCGSDQGLGKGLLVSGCSGSGASHGGLGGGGSSDSSGANNVEACTNAVSAPYTENGDEVTYEGSGGASGVAGTYFGGNGGGVIWLSTPSTLSVLNSSVLADGMYGFTPPPQSSISNYLLKQSSSGIVHGSGGGSGGSIQVITDILQGNGFFSAIGGMGSIGGGGGGAGGKLLVNYLRNFKDVEQADHTYDWSGDLYMSGGLGGVQGSPSQTFAQSGQAGTVWHPKCLPGYSGALCDACPIGTFKYGYSYGECITCSSAPSNSHYVDKAWTNADCPYECNVGFEPYNINPDCLNSFELSLQRLGAEYEFLIFATVFIVLTLIMWIILIHKSTLKMKSCHDKRVKLYMSLYQGDFVNFTSSITTPTNINENQDQQLNGQEDENQHRERLLKRSMTKVDIELTDQNLWYHQYRLYLTGDNTISYPWHIPEDFPEKLFKEEDIEKFDQLIDEKQNEFSWTMTQKLKYLVYRLVYPPYANIYHKNIRELHYKQFRNLIQTTFDQSFWNDSVGSTSIRVSCSKKDHTLAQIDFLDYYKSFKTYEGPKLPLTLILSGCGTFTNPYHLNYEDDPISKQIVLFNKQYLKDKLPLYLENLNALLSKLTFLSYTGEIMKDLDAVAEWIDYGNEHLFNTIKIRMTLYIFENSYKTEDDSLQKRRSFPIDGLLLNSFHSAFKKLIRFIKLKKFSKKSEIKLGLVFTSFNQDKFDKSVLKVKELSKKRDVDDMFEDDEEQDESSGDENDQNKKKKNFSIQNESYIADCVNELFQDDDQTTDNNDSRIQQAKKYTNKGSEELDKYKLSKAYSISMDSVKALEDAILKKRNKCHHSCDKLLMWMYSLYLMLVKHQTKPPRSQFYLVFILYTSAIVVDILLVFNFLVHLFFPVSNFYTIGMPFLLIYPFIPITAPFIGVYSIVVGNQDTMKLFVEYNALQFLFNLPLTIITQFALEDQEYYEFITFALLFNKILISFLNSKVRAHFQYPYFGKNEKKLDITFGLEEKEENKDNEDDTIQSTGSRSNSFLKNKESRQNDIQVKDGDSSDSDEE